MEKRRALGRGLQALIPNTKADVVTDENIDRAVARLNISDISPGRYQPRSDFNQKRLQELVSSIKEKGVVQPILVRKTASGYEIIAGERRVRAAKLLGIETIPAIIKEADDADAMELALIENIQREDLNPIEEAKAYERLSGEFGFTQEKIARAVGKDRTSVANMLRLLNLPAGIQKFILEEIITTGHAKALLSVSDPHRQMGICAKIIKKGLSVRETEQLVKPHAAARKALRKAHEPHLRAAQEELQRVLGTKVDICHGKKRGRLVIEYFSPSDLDRIIEIIKR